MDYEQRESWNRVRNLADYNLNASSDDDQRMATPRPEKSTFLGLSQKEVRRFSVMKLANRMLDRLNKTSHISNRGVDDFEMECHAELTKRFGAPANQSCVFLPADVTHEQRTMQTIPGSKGGYLTAPDIIGFADGLYAASVCAQLGRQTIQDQSTSVVYTKEKTGPTVTWQGPDGTSIAAADPVMAQIAGQPYTAIALTELSEQLLRQAAPVTELGITRNLAMAMGSAIDGVMLAGAGGAQPTGLLSAVGVNTVTGAAITRAVLLDMQQQSANSNALSSASKPGYVAPPATAALLAGRQEFSGGSFTQWQGAIARGMVCGVPALATKGMSAATLLFGDFSQLVLVEFGPYQLAVNASDSNFNKGICAIRLLAMVDVLILEPKAFTIATAVS